MGRRAMSRRIWILAVLAIVICPAVAASALAKGKGKGPSVRIGDNFYKPKSLKIKRGATVTWHWTGKSQHNVTLTQAPKHVKQFISNTQAKGTFSHKFSIKGSYTIVCTVHANMSMHITVR